MAFKPNSFMLISIPLEGPNTLNKIKESISSPINSLCGKSYLLIVRDHRIPIKAVKNRNTRKFNGNFRNDDRKLVMN